MKTCLARNLIFLLAISTTHLWADKVRVETKYFMGAALKESALPTVAPSWPIYSKKKITKFKGGESIELLAGPDQGTTLWLFGNRVVSTTPGGELIVSERPQDGGPVDADTSWATKLEPKSKDKHRGEDILTYEANGGFKRLWVSEKTGQPIAATEGRFITFFEISEDAKETTPPENVTQALSREKEQQEKLSKKGAMPQ